MAEFGELFSASWKEYKNNFWLYFKLVLLFIFIPGVIVAFIDIFYLKNLVSYNLTSGFDFSSFIKYFALLMLITLVSALLSVFASISILASSLFNKKTFSGALSQGKKYYFTYLGFSIVLIIFLIGLFLLFIVPGIIYLIFWIFGSVILIAENKTVLGSLKRSHELVKGRWWFVLGYFLLFGLIILGISLLFLIPGWIIQLKSPFVGNVFGLLSNFTTAPLGILFLKNFYLDMKKGKK